MPPLDHILNTENFDAQDEVSSLRVSLPDTSNGPILVPSHILAALHVLNTYFNTNERPVTPSTLPSLPCIIEAPVSQDPSTLLHTRGDQREYHVKINRVTTLDILLRHPLGFALEYPETLAEGFVGHLLHGDPQAWEDPCQYIAYARGAPNGASKKGVPVFCELLRNQDGVMVPCRRSHTTCQGCKVCPKGDLSLFDASHTSATRTALRLRLRQDRDERASSATPFRTIFERTVGRLAAYRQHGCSSVIDGKNPSIVSTLEPEQHDLAAAHTRGQRGYRADSRRLCPGRLLYLHDIDGEPFIQCEHYTREDRTHFIDYTIRDGSYDLEYLEAAFNGDTDTIHELDSLAESEGYGPRAPCNTITNNTSVRVNCPVDHRDEAGNLVPQEMVRVSCQSKFTVFEPFPEYRTECPFVLLVCNGDHRHPIPLPAKTPSSIRSLLFDILDTIKPDLPDLTPRRLLRHPVLQARLRALRPSLPCPTLSDIHVSFANREHIRSYIREAKQRHFPHGTGWEGLRHMKSAEDILPAEDIYLRYMSELKHSELAAAAGDFDDVDSEMVRIVICMTREQSRRLLRAKYLQSDIAFKRVAGFKEFELGSWDEENNVAVVFCRVFVTRETAAVHYFIFCKIEEILRSDTGSTWMWRHLHASSLFDFDNGIQQWTADQHLGQAKGLGLYLQRLACSLPADKLDLHEGHRPLSSLTVYDHLHRVFRLCTVHIKRNIQGCAVADEVKHLMRSLVCIEHDDWNGTIAAIQEEGGRAGANWVDDKIKSKFAFEAMCWEKSHIPLEVWQAGPRHSNLIEILHADANREGTSCSLVGAVFRGRNLDLLKLRSLQIHESTGIQHSWRLRGVAKRAFKSLKSQQKARVKLLKTADKKIVSAKRKYATKDSAARKARARLQRRMATLNCSARSNASGATTTGDIFTLQCTVAHTEAARVQAAQNLIPLISTGSGRVALEHGVAFK